MSAAEFNARIGTIGQEMLVPLGFQQKGANFFLYRPPVIMGVVKATWRGSFTGFHIVLTFDFMEGALGAQGRPSMSTLLEEYPVSIEAKALRTEFRRSSAATDFAYDLNFVTREVHTTRSPRDPGAAFAADAMTDADIRSVFAIALDEGLRLRDQFDPALAYRVLTRHPSADDPSLQKLRSGLEKHARANGVELPKPRKGWFRW